MTLLAFIGLVWLREQILHGGGPEWLEMEANAIQHGPNQQQPQNNIMEEDAGLVLEGIIDAVSCNLNRGVWEAFSKWVGKAENHSFGRKEWVGKYSFSVKGKQKSGWTSCLW